MMNQRQSYKEFLQSQGVNDLSYMDEDAKYIIYYMDDGDLKNGELIMFYRNETDEEIQKQASKTALKYYEDSKTVVRVRQWAEVKAFNILIVERWLGYLNQTKKLEIAKLLIIIFESIKISIPSISE